MQILISNDDGIQAEGLLALVRSICSLKDVKVLVVAPDRERSACGHGISIHQPIEVTEVPSFADNVTMYSASGTPADCVKLAIEGMLSEPPDLCLAGINRGPNLGQDVFYSGTVSSALEGALLGAKSIALSLTAFENVDYQVAAEFAKGLVQMFQGEREREKWPSILNVNIPMVPKEKISGIAVTRLGIRTYREVFQKRLDPKGRIWYWLSGTAAVSEIIDDTDVCAISRNLISITPLLKDLTDVSLLTSMGEKGEEFQDILGKFGS